MVYHNDIDEIIAFIEAFFEDDDSADYSACLKRMTTVINEKFLMDRAYCILHEVYNNDKLRCALEKLATQCTGRKSICNECPVKLYCNHHIKESRDNISDSDLQMIDLFCGAGGLSLGFTQEGFVTTLANDIQDCCVDTYAHNHPETPRDHIICGDIRDIVKDLDSLLGERHVDIVVGGPPCQGFSMANRQRLIDDPRNYLYKNYVEVVKKSRPSFFIMENVRGMLSVADEVKEDFQKVGYSVECRILNAKDFGVPQNRQRLIFIGNRIGVDNDDVFSEIEMLSYNIPEFVLDDAIFGLRPLQASRIKNATEISNEESGYKIEKTRNATSNDYIRLINCKKEYPLVLNHKARYNNDRDIEIFGRLNPGDKSDDPKIADIMPYARRNHIFKDKYFKLVPDKVCKTITAHMKFDCNMYIHPSQARGLTPREAARVQSYPDDYFFRGAYTKTYMQIGNSVPPLLGRAIARVIKRYL